MKTKVELLPKCWQLVHRALMLPTPERVYLYGLPGLGKNWAASNIRPTPGPTFIVHFSDEMPAAEIRGFYAPVDGGFQWIDGPALRAWTSPGARLILNEMGCASSDAMSLLRAVLEDDDNAVMSIPGKDVNITRSPGISIVATSNDPPESLPAPVRDRFPVKIRIDAAHPDALALLPKPIREAAKNSCILPDEGRRISLRSWQTFGRLLEGGAVDHAMAAELVFGARAADVLAGLALASAQDKGVPSE